MYSATKAGRLNISDSGASDLFYGTPGEDSRLGLPGADSDPVYLVRAAMSKLEELSSENSDDKALDANGTNEILFGVLQLLNGRSVSIPGSARRLGNLGDLDHVSLSRRGRRQDASVL